MDWESISPKLSAKLDPKNVKPAPRGKYGSYVDGYHVVSEANEIFGYGGWSYEITRLEKVSEQVVQLEKKGRDGPVKYDQFRVGYLCTVRVNVGGTYREGSAVGSGVGSPLTIADHHESAVKEAETDALKRALRCFGNTFGLALYDKEQSNVGVDQPEFIPEAFRDRVKGQLQKARTFPELQEAWAEVNDHRSQLHPAMLNELTAAKDQRKAEITPNDPAMQAPAA